MRETRSTAAVLLALALSVAVALSSAHADESQGDGRITLENVTEPAPISPDEPLLGSFSPGRAARYLDRAALHWQKKHRCGTCHTNFSYLLARPALAAVSPAAGEVRSFFENLVEARWDTEGLRTGHSEVVATATGLALNDRSVSGRLHSTTRKALDRMCGLQRQDGGWDWLKCGWPPMESDDHYGVTFAAVGIGSAPDGYARSATAEKALDGIRRYLQANPPRGLHQRAMMVWASVEVDGILTTAERRQVLRDLFALQRPDGGWAIAALLSPDHRRKDDLPQDLESSDGYATGFVVYVARRAGIPRDDDRLRRGVRWLKANQRASGRWFTRSPTRDGKHYISNAGTAYAVLALHACRELPGSDRIRL
ncbi:MAG: squalene--hopene cyclase [Planctomycetota bacterium]|nr:squalene--hopene cyclase [Planctomycetota bacterium]